jgi:AraC-like DNA-binding protein
MEGNELEMSHRELARAEAMLRGGRIDDFSRLVHDVVREIRDRKLSYDSSVAGLNQLAALTLSTFREMEVDVDASCGDSTNTPVTSDEDIGSHADGLVDTASVLFDQVRRRVGTVDGEFVHRIADYIEETVGRETNLSRIAEEFGISAGHLSRIFKEGTGESFSEFVIRQKLRKAAEILKVDAQCEIALLAYRMGYDDPSYFSRIFRRYYGMTPARYRKQHLTHQP